MEDNRLTVTNGGGTVTGKRIAEGTGSEPPGQRQNRRPSTNHLYAESEWIFGGKFEKERCGAYGFFTVSNDLTKYTKAALFNRTGRKTRLFLTFSEVDKCIEDENIGRGICVYSIKFFTEDGVWDLVGCNHPVSFTCHPQRYHDCICSYERMSENEKFNLVDKWNLWSLLPDSLHQIMFLMGDRGIPRDFRHMHGFGCRTYCFVNKDNRRFLVKFHLLTQQGILNLTKEESLKRNINHYKFARHDLYYYIKRGNYPRWKMYIQLMTEEDAEKCTFNPIDPTKVWPHEAYPLIEAGTLELHRNPIKDSMEVRHTKFSPSNLIPGIEFPKHANNYADKPDYYVQPGAFFRLQCVEAQQRLIHNVTDELTQVPELIRIRTAARFYQADKDCGKELAKELQMEIRLILEEIEWQKEMDMRMAY